MDFSYLSFHMNLSWHIDDDVWRGKTKVCNHVCFPFSLSSHVQHVCSLTTFYIRYIQLIIWICCNNVLKQRNLKTKLSFSLSQLKVYCIYDNNLCLRNRTKIVNTKNAILNLQYGVLFKYKLLLRFGLLMIT